MDIIRSTPFELLNLVVILVILPYVSHASPIPSTVHALATYATTNSFLYSNNFNTGNYRFTKPQLPSLKTSNNFIGFPQHQSVDVSTSGQISSSVPVLTNQNHNILPLGKNFVAGGFKFLSSGEISPFFTSPKYSLSSTEQADKQTNIDNGSIENNVSSLERSTITPLPDSETHSYFNNGESGNNIPSGVVSGVDRQLDHSSDGKLVTTSNTSTEGNEDYNFGNPILPETFNKQDEKTEAGSRFELENLFTRVINAPVRTISSKDTNVDVSSDTHSFYPMSLLRRQGSNIEQPKTFFSPATPQNDVFNEPTSRLPSLQAGNYRFTQPSTTQHTTNLFPGNKLAVHTSFPSQSPTLQPTQIQPQKPAFSSGPQLHPGPISNDDFSRPSFQSPANQQPINFPFQPQLQSPHGLHNNGPPPQEPENGYNPFHLHENFPEPPYESEFVNDPSLEIEESLEERQRSTGENVPPPPPPLNFAQSTLRNVRTEELLDVVTRKQVPPECVYNTISYGPNGEDCVEARKK